MGDQCLAEAAIAATIDERAVDLGFVKDTIKIELDVLSALTHSPLRELDPKGYKALFPQSITRAKHLLNLYGALADKKAEEIRALR